MSVQQKIDLAIRASGSISIQDFVEISNFSKKMGFIILKKYKKLETKDILLHRQKYHLYLVYVSLINFCLYFLYKKVHLIEFGPGNGYLTLDILNYLKSKKIEVQKISILEKVITSSKK